MERNRYEAKKLRKEKEFAMKEKLNDRSDIELLNNGESIKISLAAKWCPSVDSLYDKALLICELVARLLYPWDSDSEFEALDAFHYIVKIKSKLRKEVLVPLRNALMLLEVYMSAKQWSSTTYERVASIAMKNYTNIFLHRDNEWFCSYLEKAKHGDAKIAAGAFDMEFDEASVTSWETDYEEIQRRFRSCGMINPTHGADLNFSHVTTMDAAISEELCLMTYSMDRPDPHTIMGLVADNGSRTQPPGPTGSGYRHVVRDRGIFTSHL
nr:hypothetical protein CTI12_AA149770 [Tanacetum cinerariifolium]